MTATNSEFLDDRMFLLAVYPANLAKDAQDNHRTIVFYDNMPPEPVVWTVVTYKNVADYPVVGINHFETQDAALAYKTGVEPAVPLTSLGGQSPKSPMSIDDYAAWKAENNLSDFSPDKAPRLTGNDRGDIVVQTKDQFFAGIQQMANVIKGPQQG